MQIAVLLEPEEVEWKRMSAPRNRERSLTNREWVFSLDERGAQSR